MARGAVYDEIGIRKVINASGSMTYLGGSLIAPEVQEKMAQAAEAFGMGGAHETSSDYGNVRDTHHFTSLRCFCL